MASGKLHSDHIKLEPDLREVTPLDRIDFACHTVCKLTPPRILVRMVLSRQLLVVEAASMSDGRYTILQIEVQEPVNGYPFVKADEITGVYLRDPSWTTAPGAGELCSGMGFVAQAAEYIGFKVFYKVELQAVTAAALGHLGDTAVHGDVSEIETVRAVLIQLGQNLLGEGTDLYFGLTITENIRSARQRFRGGIGTSLYFGFVDTMNIRSYKQRYPGSLRKQQQRG